MFTHPLKYFFAGLSSKRLVQSAMLLRPQYQKNVKLHPLAVEKLVRMTKAHQPLAYKLNDAAQTTNFELPHPKPLGVLQKIPFSIERTFSGNLPVYVEFRNQRVIKRTIIRKITGDIQKLADQIRKVVSNAQVRVKVGQIVIPGIHKQSVNMLLYRLGF